MTTTSLKVVLLDNQPLYLHGMKHFLALQPQVTSVTACTAYDEFLEHLKSSPSIVFIELNLHNMRQDGFAICREIKQRYKNMFVVVLSRYNAPHLVRFAAECGAGAYFDKHIAPDTIVDFLHSFAKGEIADYYVQVSNYAIPSPGLFTNDEFEIRYLLTRQECRVMKLIVSGKEPKAILEELHISYETFRSHHNSILAKLEVPNDVELTKLALRYKLTDMECSDLPSYSLHS